MKNKKTLLIVVHGFIPENYGGVEVYTYNIFHEFKKSERIHPIILARTNKNIYRDGLIYGDQDDPDLFHIYTSHMDMTSLGAEGDYENSFKEFLINTRPDIVHFQHFLHLSLGWFKIIRDVLPKTKIFLTLQEYILLCSNNGQMVKTFQSPFDKKNEHLCLNALSSDCEKCSPVWTAARISAKGEYVKKTLKNVDLIFAPSQFLRDIMIEKLGIPPDKIIYSDYGHTGFIFSSKEGLRNKTLVIGYIGQINRFKGLHVLLDAMARIEGVYDIQLRIYGVITDVAAESYFLQKIKHRLSVLKQVKFYGHYTREQLPGILAEMDAVVVPSVWWENSPLVIQEAFLAGAPVICSNIGGMAEKVTDGVNGLHFSVNDSEDLLKKILCLYRDREKLDFLKKNIPKVKSISENVSELESIYFSFID